MLPPVGGAVLFARDVLLSLGKLANPEALDLHKGGHRGLVSQLEHLSTLHEHLKPNIVR